MYQHILIATDGSEVARNGLEHGLSLAQAVRARATVVTVTERFPAYADGVMPAYAATPSLMAEYSAGQKEAANAILAAARREADRQGVRIETLHVENAQPAETIVETGASRNCDLIVMASHGRRGVRRLILGSVASEVLALSQVPVLVVR